MKERCPADVFCPDWIQDACDEYQELTGQYPCMSDLQKDEHFIKLVARQVQQRQMEGDNL